MKGTLVAGLSLLLLACPSQPPPSSCDASCVVDAGPSGCAPGTFKNAMGQCQSVGFTACDAGFVTDSTGWTCQANVVACDAGSWAFPGEGCSALGWVQCPAGFRATGSTCEPILPSTPCTGATRASLGQSTCVPIGDCNAAFPPANATHFVDPAGPLDATHFRTIVAALQAAPDDAVIAISPGAYRQTLTPTKPVKLVGTCADRVTLSGNPAIDLQRTRVEVEGVTIRDSILAARVERGASLTLRHVVLDANERSGLQAIDPGTRVVLEDVVVRGTGPDPATSTFGQGVAGTGASVSLTDVELTRNGETALFLNNPGTTATLNGVVISETKPRASNGRLGWGIAAQTGASFSATRLVVQDSRGVGILVAQGGSTATLTDTLIRRVAASTDNAGAPFGFGLSAQATTVTWIGGGVEDVVGGLVDVQGATGSITMRNVSASGVRTGAAPRFGFEARNGSKLSVTQSVLRDAASSGVVSFDRSQVTLDHFAVTTVTGIGVRAEGGDVTGSFVDVHGHTEAGAVASRGAALSLTGCVLGGATSSGADGGLGIGASASERGVLELSGCLLEDNVTAGLYVRDVGSQAFVTNTEVRGTRLDRAGEFGQGLIVEHGAHVSLEDVSFRGNHTAGLQVQMTSSTLTANRVSVLNTLPLVDGTRGRGANASFGGALSLTSSAFVDNQQVGLFAFESRIDATDSLVRGTRADPDGRYGNGFEALTQATITFVRGAVETSAGIAAVFGGGSGVIDAVRLAGNTIALHAQDGSSIIETATVPAMLGTQQVVITPTTTFENNQSKTSADAVTVPAP